MKYLLLPILIVGFMVLGAQAQDSDKKQPVELGTVSWLRNLDEAVTSSKEEQKPIAILFQEVPG